MNETNTAVIARPGDDNFVVAGILPDPSFFPGEMD
jgi:hypothetical protein